MQFAATVLPMDVCVIHNDDGGGRNDFVVLTRGYGDPKNVLCVDYHRREHPLISILSSNRQLLCRIVQSMLPWVKMYVPWRRTVSVA